jgi:hypothetical protein
MHFVVLLHQGEANLQEFRLKKIRLGGGLKILHVIFVLPTPFEMRSISRPTIRNENCYEDNVL